MVSFGKVMFRFSIGEFCLEFLRDCGSSGAVLVSLVSVYEGNVGIQSFGFSAICNRFAVWPCPFSARIKHTCNSLLEKLWVVSELVYPLPVHS